MDKDQVRLKDLPLGSHFITSLTRLPGIALADDTPPMGGVSVLLGTSGQRRVLHREVIVRRYPSK